MTSFNEYVKQVAWAITFMDTPKLRPLISITSNELSSRASFPAPSEDDLYTIPGKWKEVVKTYLQLCKVIIFKQSLSESFEVCNELANNLNRVAQDQDNWMMGTLINTSLELLQLYKAKNQNESDDASLEKLANTVNNSFKLCLNDKSDDQRTTKRIHIYFFVGNLLKIYFKLNKLELAKSIEKVLAANSQKLPSIDDSRIFKSYAINYLYYSGLLSLDDEDFLAAEAKLTKALSLCRVQFKKGQAFILKILIPLKFYNNRITPSRRIYSQFPALRKVYQKFFEALKTGNLRLFNLEIKRLETFFLKNHLYLIIEQLRSYSILKLFKKTFFALNEKPHIPISGFQLALEYSLTYDDNKSGKELTKFSYSLDAVECILANLIYSGKIKGYMSHTNRVVVLSKKDPFPDQVLHDE